MAIKDLDLEKVINIVKKMDDVLMQSIEEYLERFFLKTDLSTFDTSLRDLLSMRSDDLVDRTERELHIHLLNTSKWRIAVRREINLRKVYADKTDRDYKTLLRYKKLDKPGKSELEKEDKLLTIDDRLMKLNAIKDVAKSFYDSVYNYDDLIEQLHFSLQRVLISKEKDKRTGP